MLIAPFASFVAFLFASCRALFRARMLTVGPLATPLPTLHPIPPRHLIGLFSTMETRAGRGRTGGGRGAH